jgi:hypothetical protein
MATTAQRLDALEAEVSQLRHAVTIREAYVETVEERAYARGRESILGVGSRPPARTPEAERWLHAVPEPSAEAAAELEAGA